jgi:hypothetical protein
MRFAARLAGVVLLVVGVTGCDKAQVAQLQSQNATITITASNTRAELFNVWDLIEDTDLNNVPDDGEVYLFCESVPVTAGNPPVQIPVQAPWRHSLRVSILRAGATEFEQVTDDSYLNPQANLTPYDNQVFTGNSVTKPNLTVTEGTCSVTSQTCSIDEDCPMGETCTLVNRTFVWKNPRQMTTVNRTVVLATSNPLSDMYPAVYYFRRGLCSASTDPGPSALAGAPQPLTFELGKGDTIRIEARKSLTAPAGLVDDSSPGLPLTLNEPVLIGRLAIDGVNITNLGGDASSETLQGDGFSFYYSSR